MGQIDEIRDAEAAKIARWFRLTEYGWVLFDRTGAARPISAARREAWEGEALARLDRFTAVQRLMPKLLFALPFGAAIVSDMLVGLIPALGGLAIWLVVIPPAIWLATIAPRYHLAQRRGRARWVKSIAMYSPLPGVELARHRRHNAFAIARNLLSVSAIGYFVWKLVVGDPLPGLTPDDISVVGMLMGGAWLLHLPARRVDATHRRRRTVS